MPQPATGSGGAVLDDASLLNPTRVHKHITLHEDPDAALIARLRAELAEARQARRPFVVSAARHSMGGQSLAQQATAVTLDQEWIEPDTSAMTYRVAAGKRWSTVIRDLDRIGYSPKVMQSNNDFGVGSTFCVNAHGWPVSHGPAGSTVRLIRLMLPDGEVVDCSRQSNADLFNQSMGGYGLTGAIIDMEIEMVPNRRLVPVFEAMPAEEFGTRFVEKLAADPAIEMAYGRLDMTISSFMHEALMITYTPTDDQGDLPEVAGSGMMSRVARQIFRRQLGSDRLKRFRWWSETAVGPRISSGEVTRNSLINEPVITLDDRDPARTDILHEYFVPPGRFADFIRACREVIPSSYQELLNVTLRYVDTDAESWLAYAPGPRIAAVMLFSQEMSLRGEADMHRMTGALIERVLAIGGTYYLPYRLHATDAQFRRGYRRAGEFVAAKRALDPDLVFTNLMWDRYMASI
ncbi:MAG: FAD-binding oxidoreductase [Pseudomonadota bacterium]|nr:FAD-binding oxidoreductase [Pseudomonadota bacterium]